jgi:hypothetical protein
MRYLKIVSQELMFRPIVLVLTVTAHHATAMGFVLMEDKIHI